MQNLLRILLLIGALAPVAMAWVWQQRAGWVQGAEAVLRTKADGGLAQRWKDLRPSVPDLPMDVGIEKLHRVVIDCGPAELGDRKFPIWRGSVGLLARQLRKAGRHLDAAELLQAALLRDPHNLMFVEALGSAFLGAGKPWTSEALLRGWLEQLPGHPALLELQMRTWLELGRSGAIEQAIVTQLPRSLSYWKHGWRLRAFGADPKDVVVSPSWSMVRGGEPNVYTLDYSFQDVPEAVSKLRLNLPNGFRGRLESLELSLTGENDPLQGGGFSGDPKARGMQDMGAGVFLAAKRGGAHFEWSGLEALELQSGSVRVRLRLRMEAQVHPDILKGLKALVEAGSDR